MEGWGMGSSDDLRDFLWKSLWSAWVLFLSYQTLKITVIGLIEWLASLPPPAPPGALTNEEIQEIMRQAYENQLVEEWDSVYDPILNPNDPIFYLDPLSSFLVFVLLVFFGYMAFRMGVHYFPESKTDLEVPSLNNQSTINGRRS
jgi:hypothetical protein